jgi:small-conductance mechanosensitive channel
MPLAVDYQGGIESAWSNVATFIPKLLAALVILLVGYIVAKAIAGILNKVLERVGFDRVVERGGVRQVLARSKYDPSDILAKLVFWTIMLLVLQLAFGVAILILVIAAAIARAVTDLLSNLLSSVQGGQVLAKGAGIAIVVFAVFAALDQLQIAPRIVTGLWYALLAALVGSVIVAVGGGGIRTMQRYWERAAGRAESRGPELREQVRSSASASTATYGDPTDEFGDGRTRRTTR